MSMKQRYFSFWILNIWNKAHSPKASALFLSCAFPHFFSGTSTRDGEGNCKVSLIIRQAMVVEEWKKEKRFLALHHLNHNNRIPWFVDQKKKFNISEISIFLCNSETTCKTAFILLVFPGGGKLQGTPFSFCCFHAIAFMLLLFLELLICSWIIFNCLMVLFKCLFFQSYIILVTYVLYRKRGINVF